MQRRTSRTPLVLGLLLLVALGVALYVWRWRGPPPGTAPEPAAPAVEPGAPPGAAPVPPQTAEPGVEPAPAPAAPPGEPVPAVDASDAWLRERAAGLSSDPLFATWLTQEGLAARFVGAIDAVADETSPRALLGFLRPSEPFRAVERDGQLLIDPQSFARYDAVAGVVASLDTVACVRLYRRAKPLLDEAWRALGHTDVAFETRLADAVRQLRAVPVPTGQEALVRPVVLYEYRDPELEALSPAQKHLLRMGPANVRRIQGKLEELQRALGLAP